MGTRARVLVAAAAIGAAVLIGPAPPASAATITVTTTADGGAGSLRDAFAQASVAVEATTIVLAEGVTYVLDDCAEGDLAHTGTQPLTIEANGSEIRQTCAGERVIATDGDLTVVEGTVAGGRLGAGIGGGIEADTADVTLVRSSVVDNDAPIGGGVAAIRVDLVESTISDNEASVGAGVWADQVARLVNSTVAGNSATTSGGGISVVNTSIELTHATIAGNVAPVGANIELQQGADSLIPFASVIGDPQGGGTDCAIAAGAQTLSEGYNVASDASCGLGGAPGDVDGGFPVELGVLMPNGGPTSTRMPLPSSFLIDLVECGYGGVPVTTDQRGVVRAQGLACDVGAVEVEQQAPPPTTDPAPTTDPPPVTAPPATPVPGAARFTG